MRAGLLDEGTHDVTMLLRPITLDRLTIKPSGWHQITTSDGATCGDQLAEGHACTWFGEGGAIAGPIAIAGHVWNKKVERIVTPDPTRAVELARELDGAVFLDEDSLAHAARLARGVNQAWSLYAEWGPSGGYADGGFGSIHGSSCCGSMMSSRAPTVSIGHATPGVPQPPFDLTPQLAGAVARCHLGVQVTADVETTLSEIVDVQVVGPADAARCVEEAIWDTAITMPLRFPVHVAHVVFDAAGA